MDIVLSIIKRLAWALFVLLLSTLVCCQPTELICAFFLFHNPPPPHIVLISSSHNILHRNFLRFTPHPQVSVMARGIGPVVDIDRHFVDFSKISVGGGGGIGFVLWGQKWIMVQQSSSTICFCYSLFSMFVVANVYNMLPMFVVANVCLEFLAS